MEASQIFTICNTAIIIPWLCLAILPHWRGTQTLVHSVFIPLMLAPVYAWLIVNNLLNGGVPGSDFYSLAGVMALFSVPEIVTAGWIHYLVFDLFVGAWISRDALRRGVPWLAVIPCLVATLMYGPIGLALYLLLRAMSRKGGISLVEGAGHS